MSKSKGRQCYSQRHVHDFYPTPTEIVSQVHRTLREILHNEQTPCLIVDVACGDGRLSEPFVGTEHIVWQLDIISANKKRYPQLGKRYQFVHSDFLTWTPKQFPPLPVVVVMNPPFSTSKANGTRRKLSSVPLFLNRVMEVFGTRLSHVISLCPYTIRRLCNRYRVVPELECVRDEPSLVDRWEKRMIKTCIRTYVRSVNRKFTRLPSKTALADQLGVKMLSSKDMAKVNVYYRRFGAATPIDLTTLLRQNGAATEVSRHPNFAYRFQVTRGSVSSLKRLLQSPRVCRLWKHYALHYATPGTNPNLSYLEVMLILLDRTDLLLESVVEVNYSLN